MEFKKVLEERYSCKKFDGREIDKESLQQILEAAQSAPTAKNLQEHTIYIAQGEEVLAKIDGFTPCRYGAATVLVVTYKEAEAYVYPGEKHNSGVEDASIVATHMMLAATSLGVDNCWVNFFDPEVAHEALGLPDDEQILMLLDLGYAAEGAKPMPTHFKRKELSETVKTL